MSKVALIILDGLGLRHFTHYNAVKNADMKFLKSLMKNYSFTKLKTKGEFVGLKQNQFGNSEVGHLNLGSGRVVKQNSTKIDDEIKNQSFFENKKLCNLIENLKQKNANLHIFGLCSNGGVHSDINHLYSLLKLCKMKDFKNVLIHFISDGRDTNTTSGKQFFEKLISKTKTLSVGKVVSVTGRFYAMDREKNYDRTEKFLNVLLNYDSENKVQKLGNVFDESYEKNITDEYLLPTTILDENFCVKDEDAILCFNFRSDRARQIFEKLIENGQRNLFSFISYDEKFSGKVTTIFDETSGKNCLSEVLSKNKKTQLRISETTKYAHVTYFFNLLNETPFWGEKRIIIEGDKTDNFAKVPFMKAKEITNKIISETDKEKYDFVLVNFPNADMVGHTGDYEKTMLSLKFLDKNLKILVENLRKKGYEVLITADHGNADIMQNKDGSPCTTHTTSDAPFIIVSDKKYKLISNGKLANVSPTILYLMNIRSPKEFTEPSLIEK